MGVCWGQDRRGRGFGLVVGWDMAACRKGRLAGQDGWRNRAAGRNIAEQAGWVGVGTGAGQGGSVGGE